MTRIFPDRIRFYPICRGFYPSVSDSEYPISVTDPYSNAQKLRFYDVNIHYNLIRQKLTLSVSNSVFEHNYKNKYDISNIRPYPIRLHLYIKLPCRSELHANRKNVKNKLRSSPPTKWKKKKKRKRTDNRQNHNSLEKE